MKRREFIAAMGGVPPAGGDRHYAAVYRDAAAFCTSGTFNATNSLRVVWGP